MTPDGSRGGLSRFVPRLMDNWTDKANGKSWRVLNGSLCFVDISGFTNLSELLAARGKIGAEELVLVLNRVFGDMLDVAYHRGGQLLKFGGDALFLLFEGDGHAIQAASAAVEMRASLRTSSQIPTSVGRVALKMSIGLHSGDIYAFSVGKQHHELIVTGPAATAVCQMESAAKPGEIMLTKDTRRLLPPHSADVERNGACLLSWRKARTPPAPTIPIIERSPSATDCVAPMLRELLGSGHAESEHRLANLAFLQFQGVDKLIERDGPDEVGRYLDDLIAGVQAECEEDKITFLSTDVSADGGKIILTTGAPFSQEDDSGRILRGARRILDAPSELEVRVGINQGHVFMGEIGTKYRSAFTVVGDAVNLAARLMAAAPPGECFVSPVLVSSSRTLFSTTQVAPFMVKGKTEPVRALSLGPEIGFAEESPDRQLPLVGRQSELARLIEIIQRDLDGEPIVATLVAKQGFGKTRLISEALKDLDLRPFIIRADPYTTASPYRAFRDTARRLLGVSRSDDETMEKAILATVDAVAPDLAPMAPLLGDVAHVLMAESPQTRLIDPQFRATRMANVVVDLLARTLPDHSVLVVEDAHWMDEASQTLLSRIEQESNVVTWAMAITRRPEPGGYRAKNALEIELGPLSTEDVIDAINRATESTPLRPKESAALAERIEGNPQFLTEIVRSIHQRGGVDALPDSLDGVLKQRVDRLPPLAGRVLRAAAILGRSFRLEVLQRTLGEEELRLDQSTQAVLDEFIKPEGEDRYRFRQPILRDVLYESVPFRRRQQLHHRAGEVIEFMAGDNPGAVASALALHYLQGRDYAQAWHYGRLAGDEAKRRFANVDAATHYQTALDASRFTTVDTAPERFDVLMSLGEVCVLAGRNEDAMNAFQRAGKTATEPSDKARAHEARAQATGRTGSFATAFRQIAAGRRVLSGAEEATATSARAGLSALSGTLLIGQQRAGEALREANRAIAEAQASGNRKALARAFQVKGVANMLLHGSDASGSLSTATELYRRLNDLPGVASVTNMLGAEAFYAGDWIRAIDFYEESRHAYFQTADDAGAALATANIGEILVLQRHYKKAIGLLRDASRTLRACGEMEQLPFVDIQRAKARLGAGQADDALLLLDRIVVTAGELGQKRNKNEAQLLGCLALLDLGLPDSAAARLADLGDDAAKSTDLGPLLPIVKIRVALALDDRPKAEAEGRLALDLIQDSVEPDSLDLVSLLDHDRVVPAHLTEPLVAQAEQLRRKLQIGS